MLGPYANRGCTGPPAGARPRAFAPRGPIGFPAGLYPTALRPLGALMGPLYGPLLGPCTPRCSHGRTWQLMQIFCSCLYPPWVWFQVINVSSSCMYMYIYMHICKFLIGLDDAKYTNTPSTPTLYVCPIAQNIIFQLNNQYQTNTMDR